MKPSSTIRRLVAVFAVAMAAGKAEAQSIRGRVIDAATERPVVGAVVVALDDAAAVGDATLTNEVGAFALDLPPTFRLTRVRLDRIGYDTQYFMPAQLQPATAVVLRVESSAITLPGIEVVAENLCGDAFASSAAVYDLWEEARKSLEITRLSQSERIGRYELMRTVRALNPRTFHVIEDSVIRQVVTAETPYRTLSIQQMTERGWVDEADDGTRTFFAPDAAILLSDEFAQQHCFGAEGTQDAILVQFVPNSRRNRLPEIAGHFVLDRATGELTELHFRYVGPELPQEESLRNVGDVYFHAAPNGVRVVREWSIRMPVPTLLASGFGARRRVGYIAEEAGRVTRIRVGGSEILLSGIRDPLPYDAADAEAGAVAIRNSSEVTMVGVDLFLWNESEVPVRVTGIQLSDCVNVAITCGPHRLDRVLQPTEGDFVFAVTREDLFRPIEFAWTYTFEPLPLPASPDPDGI